MQDGPRYGIVTGNTIDRVFRGALDEPTNYDGAHLLLISGVRIPCHPAAHTLRRTNYRFKQLVPALRSRGINLHGATNVTLDGNMFVDRGEPLMIDETTPVATTDSFLNNGVYSGAPSTVTNLTVLNNDFIDTRATPVMNYAIIPALVALSSIVIRGNTLRRLRQPLAEIVKADKLVPSDGRFNIA